MKRVEVILEDKVRDRSYIITTHQIVSSVSGRIWNEIYDRIPPTGGDIGVHKMIVAEINELRRLA